MAASRCSLCGAGAGSEGQPERLSRAPSTADYAGPSWGMFLLLDKPFLPELFKLYSHGSFHPREKLLCGWLCIPLGDDLLALV